MTTTAAPITTTSSTDLLDWNISKIENINDESLHLIQEEIFDHNLIQEEKVNKKNENKNKNIHKVLYLLKKIEGASKIQTYLLNVALPNAQDDSKRELILYDLRRLSEYINLHSLECQKRISGGHENSKPNPIHTHSTPERTDKSKATDALTPASFDRLLSKLMSPVEEKSTLKPSSTNTAFSESVLTPSENTNPPNISFSNKSHHASTSSSNSNSTNGKIFFSLNSRTPTVPLSLDLDQSPPPSPPPSPPISPSHPPLPIKSPSSSDSPLNSPFSMLNISQDELTSLLPSPLKVHEIPQTSEPILGPTTSTPILTSPEKNDSLNRRLSHPHRFVSSHRLPQKESPSPNSRTFPLARPSHLLHNSESKDLLPPNKMNLRQVLIMPVTF